MPRASKPRLHYVLDGAARRSVCGRLIFKETIILKTTTYASQATCRDCKKMIKTMLAATSQSSEKAG